MGIWVFLDLYVYAVYSIFSRVPMSFGLLVTCRMADCIGYGNFGIMDILTMI
jgi:hypothetical protein